MASEWQFDEWFEQNEEQIAQECGEATDLQARMREKWLETAYMLGRVNKDKDRCEVCPLCEGKGKVKNKALPVQIREDGPSYTRVECYHCRGVGKVLKKEES